MSWAPKFFDTAEKALFGLAGADEWEKHDRALREVALLEESRRALPSAQQLVFLGRGRYV